jgi:hypothetical protein
MNSEYGYIKYSHKLFSAECYIFTYTKIIDGKQTIIKHRFPCKAVFIDGKFTDGKKIAHQMALEKQKEIFPNMPDKIIN